MKYLTVEIICLESLDGEVSELKSINKFSEQVHD